ncbi:MerR family transcriptional regulator [[Clostridium] symbiosum]|uniref:MerR family transcriptional regulator n=1 Tax=Clostridium symbiosum TaxID=1512 RepID=UPI0032C13AF3
MKIGEFARVCNVTKDTVRYYVNIGLLIPKMQGSQMSFEEREYADFNYIQKLKGMRFNIKEIRAFLYLRRMSNMIEPATIDECVKLLEDKKECLTSELKMLGNSIHLIEDEIENFNKRKNAAKNERTGVPVGTIPLLVCPNCRQHLHIENAEINYKYIYEGILSCPCGYHATIENGIVRTENIYEGSHDRPDLRRKLYHDIGEDWEIYVQKCSDAIIERIDRGDWNGKVIMEANVNGFFFTYNNIHQLPRNCTYIIVDKYYEVLAMYKELFERLFQGLDILYIADASERFPLQDGCIDLFLSFYGEMEYSLYHKNTQLEDILHLMKPDSLVVGGIQSLEKEAKSRRLLLERYPEGNERRINKEFLEEDYKKCGYRMSAAKVGQIMKTEDHHMYTCHLDGEPLTIYYFEAEKEG